MFSLFTAYQPTLFEIMGISRDGGKTKENSDNETTDPKEDQDEYDNTVGNIGKELESLGDKIDGVGVGVDDDNEVQIEYVPERECDDRIHRLAWNNGARDNTNIINEETGTTSGSIFETILQMTQEDQDIVDDDNTKEEKSLPLWDDLFESKNGRNSEASKVDTEVGLDDLLGLFEDGATDSSKDSCSVQSSSQDEKPRIDMSLLSQGAQVVANEMVSSFSSREKTPATLEHSCPNWKENIYFALLQKDPNDIQEALVNVRQSRIRMQAQRKIILDAWEGKNVALEVFESALKKSAARLNSDDSSTSQQNGDAGFMTQDNQNENDNDNDSDNILTQREEGDQYSQTKNELTARPGESSQSSCIN